MCMPLDMSIRKYLCICLHTCPRACLYTTAPPTILGRRIVLIQAGVDLETKPLSFGGRWPFMFTPSPKNIRKTACGRPFFFGTDWVRTSLSLIGLGTDVSFFDRTGYGRLFTAATTCSLRCTWAWLAHATGVDKRSQFLCLAFDESDVWRLGPSSRLPLYL